MHTRIDCNICTVQKDVYHSETILTCLKYTMHYSVDEIKS